MQDTSWSKSSRVQKLKSDLNSNSVPKRLSGVIRYQHLVAKTVTRGILLRTLHTLVDRMKIVERTQFLNMPAGTMFFKYSEACFDALRIKGETIGNDFCYQPLDCVEADTTGDFFRKLDFAVAGNSINLDFDCQSRDGLFDADQLFAVLEKSDVEKMLACIIQATESAYV